MDLESPYLHNLALCLHGSDMPGYLILHAIHISGTSMKHLGIYGLSWVYFLEGILSVKYPLIMLPMDKGALKRSTGLEKCIRNILVSKSLVTLK